MNKYVMKIRTCALLFSVAFALFLTSCSDSGSSWYDDSSERKDDRDRFIELQSSMGMSDAEASRLYDMEEAEVITTGRDPATTYDQ